MRDLCNENFNNIIGCIYNCKDFGCLKEIITE